MPLCCGLLEQCQASLFTHWRPLLSNLYMQALAQESVVPGELEPLDDGVPMLPELLLDNDVTVVVGVSLAEPPVHCRLKEVQGPPVCCHLRVQVCQGPPVRQLLEPVPV